MNITSHTGTVHLGTHIGTNHRGRDIYAKACGNHNQVDFVGYRSATNFYPTKAEVTCKRCLKRMAKEEAAKSVEVAETPAAEVVEISKEATDAIAGFTEIHNRTDAIRIAQDLRAKAVTARKTGTVRATRNAELFEEVATGLLAKFQ